ncbi:MAG: hypothetical protein MH219_20040 [Marinobacter sp.]|nr:hypothetical protein [Marinobacter sp.]
MQQQEKVKYLKTALYVFGVIFIVGVPAMMMWVWPSGWAGHQLSPSMSK